MTRTRRYKPNSPTRNSFQDHLQSNVSLHNYGRSTVRKEPPLLKSEIINFTELFASQSGGWETGKANVTPDRRRRSDLRLLREAPNS